MRSEIRRRDVLVGSLGVAVLSGCSRRRAAGELPRVTIVRASVYSDDLTGKIRALLAEHRLDVRGKRVLLKPNLVEFDPGTTVNTHPSVVLAAYEVLRSMDAAEVRVAEGPGHRRATLDLAEAAGYFAAFSRFESIFTDLNLDEVSAVEFPRRFSRLRRIYLPNAALGCDLLVSMPKMKTHHWVGATLSMKNLFGLVPGGVYGWPKNVLHWAGIHECIADLCTLFSRTFAIVDGIEGMEGNGPIQGKRKHAGVLVGGGDLAAVDATCCRIMGIDPSKVRYLRLCEDRGQTEAENVRQTGESISAVRTPFELIPEFQSIRLAGA